MLNTALPQTESRESLLQMLHGRPLAEAIEDAMGKVQREPAAVRLRWLLFQLLSINGDWIRAIKQLQSWASLSADHLRTAQVMRELLRAEAYRCEVFKGAKEPGWLDAAPASAGHANPGDAFSWITDSDTRLGPHCELYLSGGYRWVPFSRVARLSFPPVQGALDLIWRQCKVTLCDQTELSAYMPARYPVSRDDDDAIKLATVTRWTDHGDTTVAGAGQRTWRTDAGTIAMLSVLSVHVEGRSVECE